MPAPKRGEILFKVARLLAEHKEELSRLMTREMGKVLPEARGDVQEAIDMPRGLHYEGFYQLEDSVPAEIVEGLKKIGHKTTTVVGPLGGGQAIWIDWDKGTLTGGSDPRKDGCALGY